MLFLFQQHSDIFKRKKSEVTGSVFGLRLQTVLRFDLIIKGLGVESNKDDREKMGGPSHLWQNEGKCSRPLGETVPKFSSSPADLLYMPSFQSDEGLAFLDTP